MSRKKETEEQRTQKSLLEKETSWGNLLLTRKRIRNINISDIKQANGAITVNYFIENCSNIYANYNARITRSDYFYEFCCALDIGGCNKLVDTADKIKRKVNEKPFKWELWEESDVEEFALAYNEYKYRIEKRAFHKEHPMTKAESPVSYLEMYKSQNTTR